jgi:predicted DNA-binding transcriptional regulator AlpA
MTSHLQARTIDINERLTVRIPQALSMIGLGRSMLYELVSAGEIETIKVGKATLVIVSSLNDFVERRRRPPHQ